MRSPSPLKAAVIGIGVGLTLMLMGFYLVPKPGDGVIADRLTDVGRKNYFPERDIPVYYVGILVVCVLPALLVGREGAGGLSVSHAEGGVPDRLEGDPTGPGASWIDVIWLTGMGAVIVVLLAVPDISILVERIYRYDAFHHWEFFGLGPALHFRAGRALGSEAYSQYGMGLPLLSNGIAPIMPLRFDNLMRIGVGLGCGYFLGLALLLRARLGNRLWATVGTLTAIGLQCFTGTTGLAIWTFPSSTVLRYLFDVWFFLALWGHIRSDRKAWIVACGLINGLALSWELDTGIYLLGVAVAYHGLRGVSVLAKPRGETVEITWLVGFAAVALQFTVAIVTVVTVWLIANRGPIDGVFLRGVLEPITTYASGMACLPMSALEPHYIVAFLVVMVVYLWPLARTAALLRGIGTITNADQFRTCLGLYGLATCNLFIQRSAAPNLSHVIVPFCILVTDMILSAVRLLARRSAHPQRWITASGAAAIVGILLVMFAANSSFRSYPSLLKATLKSQRPSGEQISLGSGTGITGLLETHAEEAEHFREVTARLAGLQAEGHHVAILDYHEPRYCLESGVAPHDRYCPSLNTLIHRDQLEAALVRFEGQRFDYVMMDDPISGHVTDAESAYLEILERGYELIERFGMHRIYKRR